jgi:DNA-directed RNA polymerase subunit RPC12/RpoP
MEVCPVRHNHRPPILASNLPPSQLSMHPGEATQYVCADCGRWTLLRRGIALSHRAADGVTRCPGSGQRLTRDITPAEWAIRLREGTRDVGGRHVTTRRGGLHYAAKPPAPRAVCQIAAGR